MEMNYKVGSVLRTAKRDTEFVIADGHKVAGGKREFVVIDKETGASLSNTYSRDTLRLFQFEVIGSMTPSEIHALRVARIERPARQGTGPDAMRRAARREKHPDRCEKSYAAVDKDDVVQGADLFEKGHNDTARAEMRARCPSCGRLLRLKWGKRIGLKYGAHGKAKT